MTSSAPQVLQQAEALKASVAASTSGSNEAWMKRQNLQDMYQQLLVMDLEYALDKKVEQDLWNHAFKNQINTLQNQAKDKQNPKRGETQASLNLFLETASGFYLQLLQELCTAFKLDLPFRRNSSHLGIFKERGNNQRIKTPKKTSCMYICQHCLVHLGDIARYRQQIEQAQTYYRHAARLVPYNGQPYNQLAILEAAKGSKLSTVFFYVRSIAVRHPFPVATTNLDKFYIKISKETLDYKGKLSMSEIVSSFLQFHAFIHLSSDLDKAHRHIDRLVASLPSHVTSMSFSSFQLVQMVAINLFTMHYVQRKLDSAGSDGSTKENMPEQEKLSKDEEKCYNMVFNLTVSLFDTLLHYTPKQESKARDYHTLPALKVILDWIKSDDKLLNHSCFKNSALWLNLSKLLSNIQTTTNSSRGDQPSPDKCEAYPLPEDHDLQCFLPLHKCYSEYDFTKHCVDMLTHEQETAIRCHRLVQLGIWVADKYPSMNLMNYERLNCGRIQFTASTAQYKVLVGNENDMGFTGRSQRQNVAIQAIMQNSNNKAKKSDAGTTPPGPGTPEKRPQADHKGSGKGKQEQVIRIKRKETPTNLKTKTQPPPTDPQEYPPLPAPKHPTYPSDTQSSYKPQTAPTQDIPSSSAAPPASSGRSTLPEKINQDSPIPAEVTHMPFQGLPPNIGPVPIQRPPPPLGPVNTDQLISTAPPGGTSRESPVMPPSHRHPVPAGVGVPMVPIFGPQRPMVVPGIPLAGISQNRDPQVQAGSGIIPGQGSQDFQPINKPGMQPHMTGHIGQDFPPTQNLPMAQYQQQCRPMMGGRKNSPGQTQMQPPMIDQHKPQADSMFYRGPTPDFTRAPPGAMLTSELLQQLQEQGGTNQLLAELQQQSQLHLPPRQVDKQLPAFDDPAVLHRAGHSSPIDHPGPTHPQTQSSFPIRPPPEQIMDNYGRNIQPHMVHMNKDAGIDNRSHGVMKEELPGPQGVKAPRPIHPGAPGHPLQRQNLTGHPQRQPHPRQTIPQHPLQRQALPGNFMSSVPHEPPPPVETHLPDMAKLSRRSVPKPDSPPPSINSSSFFSSPMDNDLDSSSQPVTSTYSLFSQSPWSVQINKPEKKGLGTSPFGSPSSSLRGSPDAFIGEKVLPPPGGTGDGLNHVYGGFNHVNMGWKASAGSAGNQLDQKGQPLLPHNMQSLWSSGPSPLERLLEQQKHQRQNDPH